MSMNSLSTARGNPYLTMIWLSIGGSFLLFLFLILVFVLRTQAPDWIPIPLPLALTFSTLVILFSSVSLHFSVQSFQAESYRNWFFWTSITLTLGLAFGLLQMAGCKRILDTGPGLAETSVAFMVLFSALHFLHIVLGLGGLFWVWLDSFTGRSYVDGFISSLNPKVTTRIRVVTVFWHFLDGIWILLYSLLWWQSLRA